MSTSTTANESILNRITPELVSHLFPFTPAANIRTNLPSVLAALTAANLTDQPMLLMALGTIRAETESFEPISEQPSPYNTSSDGKPFDLYDCRTDLGNQGPPDGSAFRGRGYVQITGRFNYARYALKINEDLTAHPELANQPTIAARLLACFLADRAPAIRRALSTHDLPAARRLVNGGSNGLDRFRAVFTLGEKLLA